jgi:septum site-determining protein MinC
MSQLIALKGSRNGLRLQLDETADWDSLLAALREQLQQGTHFFNGAQVTVDIGGRALSDDQVATLLTLMQEHGLKADALASTERRSRDAARAAGVTTRVINRTQAAEPEDRSEATVVMRTLRSGQQVRHHGHITVIGDVNAGSEVIAGGSVIVFGRLRGIVHAGALGDQSAVICAIELTPTQLRIGEQIARNAEGGGGGPEIARISGERIIVEPWNAVRR